MTEPGPAQLELIRRYARTMREMHADAMAARGPRIGARAARHEKSGSEPARQAGDPRTSRSGGASGRSPEPA